MQTSQLNKIFEKDPCLTADMIGLYVGGNTEKELKHKIEKHLVDCELCSLAIEGSMVVPIVAADIDDIHNRIDKSIGTSNKPKGRSRGKQFLYTTLVASVAFGIYYFMNNYNGKVASVPQTVLQPEPLSKPVAKKELTQADINEIIKNKQQVQVGPAPTPTVITRVAPMEKIESKELFLQPSSPASPPDKLPLIVVPANDEIIYLHNCKVANARKLYYKSGVEVNILRDVPSPNEKKNNSSNSNLDDRQQVAIEMLNKGLEYFSAGNYSNAYNELQILVESNEKDINALFYSALCMYNLNNTKGAKNRLTKLVKDHFFGEEANWYYALCLIKENNIKDATLKLNEIVNANGFYALQAKKKLEDLTR